MNLRLFDLGGRFPTDLLTANQYFDKKYSRYSIVTINDY
jgi:hypothetical protein